MHSLLSFLGSGLGMCGAPTTVIVPHYFTARRPLAYGIGLSGVGLGAFAFPQVVSLLVTQYNLRGALLLTGGLSLHLTLCGTIFKPGRELKQMTTNGEKGIVKLDQCFNLSYAYEKLAND